MKRMTFFALLLAALAAACTKPENRCAADSDCTNPAYPFCDADGEYAPSDGQKGVCTIVPPDCPVERCGCTAGATTCGSNMLSVCNSDGMSVTTTTCDVGCESDGTACKTFEPSNGLAPVLAGASKLPALAFPDGALINTDTGVVSASDGTVIHDGSVSTLVTFGATTIRVYAAPSLTLQSVKATGSLPMAFVAATTIEIDGLLDLSADGSSAGPGAAAADSSANGVSTIDNTLCQLCTVQGAGGGGNFLAGGSGGGGSDGSGGLDESAFTLVGGGSGGSVVIMRTGTVLSTDFGGAGGGGIQLVAAQQVTVNGIIDAGGGGGSNSGAGGGAGGLVVIESPQVTIGATGGIAANGGGGGGCGVSGGDGTPDAVAALGGEDPDFRASLYGGTGGIVTSTTTTEAGGEGLPNDGAGFYGGGGGSVGRARIATFDGTFMQDASAVMSVVVTTDMLQTQ